MTTDSLVKFSINLWDATEPNAVSVYLYRDSLMRLGPLLDDYNGLYRSFDHDQVLTWSI
jgi:hypothetical protein